MGGTLQVMKKKSAKQLEDRPSKIAVNKTGDVRPVIQTEVRRLSIHKQMKNGVIEEGKEFKILFDSKQQVRTIKSTSSHHITIPVIENKALKDRDEALQRLAKLNEDKEESEHFKQEEKHKSEVGTIEPETYKAVTVQHIKSTISVTNSFSASMEKILEKIQLRKSEQQTADNPASTKQLETKEDVEKPDAKVQKSNTSMKNKVHLQPLNENDLKPNDENYIKATLTLSKEFNSNMEKLLEKIQSEELLSMFSATVLEKESKRLKTENQQLRQKINTARELIQPMKDKIQANLEALKNERLKIFELKKDRIRTYETYKKLKLERATLKADIETRYKEKDLLYIHITNLQKEILRTSDKLNYEKEKVDNRRSKIVRLTKTLRRLEKKHEQ